MQNVVVGLLLLALLAVGTSLQVGCGGTVENSAGTDDAIREDAGRDSGCYGYGYGYGGCGYGGCGYDR